MIQALPEIDKKVAIPIRLIPFITNGNVGPESLAELFSEKQGLIWWRSFCDQDRLPVFRQLPNGQIHQMKRPEWDTPLFSIQSLSERYDKENRHYNEWLEAAINLLPPAFVWKDDFEKLYAVAMSPDFVTPEHAKWEMNEEEEVMECLCDPAERELSWASYISEENLNCIFEGFETVTPVPVIEKLVTQPRTPDKISGDTINLFAAVEWQEKPPVCETSIAGNMTADKLIAAPANRDILPTALLSQLDNLKWVEQQPAIKNDTDSMPSDKLVMASNIKQILPIAVRSQFNYIEWVEQQLTIKKNTSSASVQEGLREETPAEYVAKRLNNKQDKDIIAAELHEIYGQNINYGTIARLLPKSTHAPNASNAAWRQRGYVMVKKGIEKKKMTGNDAG
jgi:hypothetical protein